MRKTRSCICKKISILSMAFVLLGIMTTGCSKNSARSTKDSIGIIGAMDSEVDTLKEATVEKKSTTVAGMEFVEGKLKGKSVVIVKCGVGKVNAGICADLLINHLISLVNEQIVNIREIYCKMFTKIFDTLTSFSDGK